MARQENGQPFLGRCHKTGVPLQIDIKHREF